GQGPSVLGGWPTILSVPGAGHYGLEASRGSAARERGAVPELLRVVVDADGDHRAGKGLGPGQRQIVLTVGLHARGVAARDLGRVDSPRRPRRRRCPVRGTAAG